MPDVCDSDLSRKNTRTLDFNAVIKDPDLNVVLDAEIQVYNGVCYRLKLTFVNTILHPLQSGNDLVEGRRITEEHRRHQTIVCL